MDGGLTDNNPFDLARGHLRSGGEGDYAVITIAPFPAHEVFDPDYDPAQHSGLFAAALRLFGALLSQSRFFGESLATMAAGSDGSQFVIAPSDASLPGQPALQCAALGAFAGFFERGFREHDYALGRRNCQQFLRCHFTRIPLCGTAVEEVPLPARARISSAAIDEIVDLIAARFKAILPPLIEQVPSGPLRVLLGLAARAVPVLAKRKLKKFLQMRLASG